MKKIFLYYAFIAIALSHVLAPAIAHADDLKIIGTPGQIGGGGDRPTQLAHTSLSGDLQTIWEKIQGYVFILGGLAALYIIWNGIRYVMSQGDPKKVEEAKRAIIQAVLAIALLAGSSIVISIIWAIARTLATGTAFVAR